MLLWFEVDDFDAAVERARGLSAEILQEPHVNPHPQHREVWLRDPDGYVVVVASPDGETADGRDSGLLDRVASSGAAAEPAEG